MVSVVIPILVFFTVDKNTDSNMFMWFFPSTDPKAPLLVWLQGGPGASSMYGMFAEIGPFSVAADKKTLLPRSVNWNNKYSLIFIDNPVGTGFSYTASDNGFVKNEDQVGLNLYSTLYQFYQIFEEYRSNELYITGESYAGHYVPACAFTIHKMNQNATNKKLNLKGIAVGDGLFDMESQSKGIGRLAYNLGLADENEVYILHEYEANLHSAIRNKDYVLAFDIFDELLNGDFYPYPTYFYNITGSANYFNIRDVNYPPNPYPDYLTSADIRKRIHVGSVGYSPYNATVERHLIPDVAKSVRHLVESLLDNKYKVLIYNGQNDLIISGPLTEVFLRTLKWNGSDDYKKVAKIVWRLKPTDPFVAGFVRQADNLWQVIIRDAGHMVPADQPDRAFDMITRFVDNKPFN